MGICYIVGAGDCESIGIEKKTNDIIIAADGGYKYLQSANIKPDIIVGDFDSLGETPCGDNVIKLNPVKDITDMNAAVDIGIEKGFDEFAIYGATGGRIDHSLANIQLLASLSKRGMKATIINGNTFITAVTDGKILFDSSKKGFISVFAHSDICGNVCIKGLKYSLENAELKNDFSLGVSNEFIGMESCVSVEKGTLIIVVNA